MIQKSTLLKILDNSGGRLARCIQVYGNKKGNIGDKILVSIQKIKQKTTLSKSKIKVENHTLYKALILHTKKGIVRKDNTHIFFNKNSIALLTRTNEKLISTRILGTLVKELRNKKYMKILTVGSRII
jgi:large subunit ribosomal protein L14